MRDQPTKLEAFVAAMRRRLVERRNVTERDAHGVAIDILDGWEGEVELTEECARAIVDEAIVEWGVVQAPPSDTAPLVTETFERAKAA